MRKYKITKLLLGLVLLSSLSACADHNNTSTHQEKLTAAQKDSVDAAEAHDVKDALDLVKR
jgi:uncharacterized lipoprotein YajG